MCVDYDIENLQPVGLVLPFPTQVDFDPDKEQENRRIHGYSLASVEDWVNRLTFPIGPGCAPTVGYDEITRNGECRWRVITVDWEGNIVFFVFNIRRADGNTVLRVISYRRASEREEDQYRNLVQQEEVEAWVRLAQRHEPPNI